MEDTMDDFEGTLAELLRRLRTCKDLMDVWTWFHDGLVAHEEFLDMGEPFEDAKLLKTAEMLGRHVCGREAQAMPLFIRLAESGFCHGSVMFQNPEDDRAALGILMFFERERIGLCGVSRLPLTRRNMEQVLLMRFTMLDAAVPNVLVARRAEA